MHFIALVWPTKNLITGPVMIRSIPRSWHPRTGSTAFLLLPSATTELMIINPSRNIIHKPNPEHARHPHAGLVETLWGLLAFPNPFLSVFPRLEFHKISNIPTPTPGTILDEKSKLP
jgi:hypothetical protein